MPLRSKPPARPAARSAGTTGLSAPRIPVLAANVRWLAGYRHPRNAQPEVTAALREAFTVPGALMDGAQQVGDPIAILPVLFHLLWSQVLTVDLSRPLHDGSPVAVRAAR